MSKPMIDRTFVRVQDENGKWVNASVREMTHVEFRDWTVNWYKRAGATYNFGETETSPAERENVLAMMIEHGIPPVMLVDTNKLVPDD